MSTISHKSTAKATIRNLITEHGKSGTLNLLREVLEEGLPARRGRPTRNESVTRLMVSTLETLIPEVVFCEEKVTEVAERVSE